MNVLKDEFLIILILLKTMFLFDVARSEGKLNLHLKTNFPENKILTDRFINSRKILFVTICWHNM